MDLSKSKILHTARELLSRAVHVMQAGEKRVFSDSLSMYLLDDQFVVESVPSQPDQWGRESPIISYGSLAVTDGRALTGEEIVSDIVRFAKTHGLSFKEEHDWSGLALKLNNTLKKKELSQVGQSTTWRVLILASNLLTTLSMALYIHYGLKIYLALLLASLIVPGFVLVRLQEKSKPRRKSAG